MPPVQPSSAGAAGAYLCRTSSQSPPLVIIFIFYFFLSEQIVPVLGIEDWARSIARGPNAEIWAFLFGDMRQFPALASGVIVLALFESAFAAEALRAGIQSIERGQWEAAAALGLRSHARMRLVILPQGIQRALPPLANQFISLVKDSSIVSLISIQELTYMTLATVATSGAIFEAWLTTAGFYFVICWILSLVFRRIERRGAGIGPGLAHRAPEGRGSRYPSRFCSPVARRQAIGLKRALSSRHHLPLLVTGLRRTGAIVFPRLVRVLPNRAGGRLRYPRVPETASNDETGLELGRSQKICYNNSIVSHIFKIDLCCRPAVVWLQAKTGSGTGSCANVGGSGGSEAASTDRSGGVPVSVG